MEDADDDDLKLQRASLHAIALIKERIPRLLRSFEQQEQFGASDIQSRAEGRAVVALLDVFQEEPQLLDPHLKSILPPLASRCSHLIHSNGLIHGDPTAEMQLNNIADIIYTLCKVRGEKVVVRFLDNQPIHILPVIGALKYYCEGVDSSITPTKISGSTHTESLGLDENRWKLRYFLLLWAGHLVLTPFDLSSISEGAGSLAFERGDLKLPLLPNIAKSMAKISLGFLESSSKEQSSAASLLVKLVLRPDILKTKALDLLIKWALELLSAETGDQSNIHIYTFALQFLYGLLRSADARDICHQFPPIFRAIIRIFGDDQEDLFSSVRQSAVARRLAIKTLRAIMTQLLQSANTGDSILQAVFDKMVQQSSVLEDIVDFLLKRLADRDTQVRYAASKALSIITTKLDRDMGEEVVEAIIGSLGEDVLTDGNTKDLSSVNPLRWHGLTLTLSHMLFRRSPSPEQLDNILDALYLTLTFEQRSSTGNSLGTNVRDAANFGLWSLARRYTTAELLAAPVNFPPPGPHKQVTLSKIQYVANNLLVSACLDPSGNVRRGSSAALQELIGRHPDQIKHGIALVQIVDYQAVGLRRRAMIDVAFKASDLETVYRAVLLDGLFGWRGLQAPDTTSRNFAALSVAKLTSSMPREELSACMDSITSTLRSLSVKDIERRHGLTKTLAELVLQRASAVHESSAFEEQMQHDTNIEQKFASNTFRLWSLFDSDLRILPKDLGGSSTRSSLTSEATVSLVYALALYAKRILLRFSDLSDIEDLTPTAAALSTLDACLKSTDESTLETIPLACETVCCLLSHEKRMELVKSWLLELNAALTTRRKSGLMLAIASARCTLRLNIPQEQALQDAQKLETQILDILIRVFDDGDVDARVMAIRCLATVADAVFRGAADESVETELFKTFSGALNDYTTNERGDVGSLVRLEAIEGMRRVWSVHLNVTNKVARECYFSIQRLALERLDKVRLQAARCLRVLGHRPISQNFENLSDVSTYDYFFNTALFAITRFPAVDKDDDPVALEDRLNYMIEGFASSTTGGSDSLIPTAQSALYSLLDALPAFPTPETSHVPSLLDVSNSVISLLRAHQANERILVSLLEMSVFLFDAGLFARLPASATATTTASTFKARTLLSLVQKSHFKSSSLAKLLACLHLYRHLAAVPATRVASLRKMTAMLGHPFPKVRIATAEALWAVVAVGGEGGGDGGVAQALVQRDWGGVSANEGKALGEELGRRLGVV